MSVHEYEVREARLEDTFLMAYNMRKIDVQEVWASSRSKPLEALVNSVKGSERARTGLVDGEIACMF